MPIIDSHCHLQSLAPDDADRALEEARARGVTGFLVPATRLDEAEAILALCDRHPDVWCALGVHPHEASSWGEGDEARLRALLAAPKAVAVGECGLDFHYDHSPREVQERVLRAQWALAIELGLPAVVHNRDSDERMLELVREGEHADLEADFHSFSGSLEMADELIGRGFYLGVTGMVTFRRADNIRAILGRIPDDRLLVETDAPYLAPVPHRGKPNRPAWVVEVAARVAEERGWTGTEVGDRTTANFFGLFRRAALYSSTA